MGPVGGGRLGSDSDVLGSVIPSVRRIPELALRFVPSNPKVAVALSGMSTMGQVEENTAVASSPVQLKASDQAVLDEHIKKLKAMTDLYCTGCGYCLPCPKDVAVPRVFEFYNRGRVYGLWDDARRAYGMLGKAPWLPGKPGSACVECGECEKKCPQKFPIRSQLQEAHAALKKAEGSHRKKAEGSHRNK